MKQTYTDRGRVFLSPLECSNRLSLMRMPVKRV